MTAWSLSRLPFERPWGRLRRSAFFPGTLPIFAFLIVASLAAIGVNQQATLSVTGSRCDTGWCIRSAYPAGFAWSEGVREGDTILLVNGQPLQDDAESVGWRYVRSITVIGSGSEPIRAEAIPQPIGSRRSSGRCGS